MSSPALRSQQQGIAILTAMLIMAVAVTVAAALVATLHYDIKLSGNLQDMQQNYLYVEGVEHFVTLTLEQEAEQTKHDSLDEEWTKERTFSLDDAHVKGHLEELHGKFNLNSLLHTVKDKETGESKPDTKAEQRLRKYLQAHNQPVEFADAIMDWLDEDSTARAAGAENDYYQTSEIPYLAANAQMVDTSELHLLRLDSVYDQEERLKQFNELASLFTALPTTQSKINVNTASAELLESFNFNKDHITSIVSQQKEQPFKTLDDFLKAYKPAKQEQQPGQENPQQPKETVPWDLLSVTSHYFLLDAKIELGESTLAFHSLIERNDKGKAQVVYRQLKPVAFHRPTIIKK